MYRYLILIAGCAALLLANAGCAEHRTPTTRGSDRAALNLQQLNSGDVDELNSRARRFADLYTSRVSQACDDMEDATHDPAIAKFARNTKVAEVYAAMSSAVGRNPGVNLMDLAVQVTLRRMTLEEYTIPKLLHDEGKELLRAVTQSESDIWGILAGILTEAQLAELRDVIAQWRAQNPDARYTSLVRFSDFAQYLAVTKSKQSTRPGSIFSLLYLDPLANLDPVAAEVRESRMFAERMAYLLQRMPLIVQGQAELTAANVLESPQIERFLTSSARFADATKKFSDATAAYPQDLTKERQAAIEQLGGVVSNERAAMMKELNESLDMQRRSFATEVEKQQGLLAQRLTQLDATIQTAHDGIVRLTDGSREAVREAEASTHRVTNHVFWVSVVLAVLVLVGLPISVRASRASRAKG